MDEIQELDKIMITAIVALLFIFFGALITLVLVCRRQEKYRNKWNRLDVAKKKGINDIGSTKDQLAYHMDDMLGTALDKILNDQQWIDDASGLIPHCLAVLKICHRLTEGLADLAMSSLDNRESSSKLIVLAKKIPPRVDDVVKSMYPPIDPRLLEARVTALVLTVGQMALLTQNMCNKSKNSNVSWIEQGLSEMDSHLIILRRASIEMETTNSNRNEQNHICSEV